MSARELNYTAQFELAFRRASLFAQWRTYRALHERIRPSIKTGPAVWPPEIYITVLTIRSRIGNTSIQLVALGSRAR